MMSNNKINYVFENTEAYARMNYIIDVVRGNIQFIPWSKLSNELKEMYIKEAKVAHYIITEADLENIEDYITNIRNSNG